MAKKVKAVSGDTMSRLNRISPATNFLFNTLFTILALMCFLPIVFIAIISLTNNNVIRADGYQLWLTAETMKKLQAIDSIIAAYRYDNSNGMVDYFDTNFYYDLRLKPVAA